MEIRIRHRQVVDRSHMRGRGAEVLNAGREAFCSREQEVFGKGLVGFGGVGCGLQALLGGEARAFGEGDEPWCGGGGVSLRVSCEDVWWLVMAQFGLRGGIC